MSQILTDTALNAAFGNGTTKGDKSIATTGNIQGDNMYSHKYYIGEGDSYGAYISYNATTGAIEFNN